METIHIALHIYNCEENTLRRPQIAQIHTWRHNMSAAHLNEEKINNELDTLRNELIKISDIVNNVSDSTCSRFHSSQLCNVYIASNKSAIQIKNICKLISNRIKHGSEYNKHSISERPRAFLPKIRR